jgi:hypothetical protein
MSYVPVDGTRHPALQANRLADAARSTVRRKLFKIGAFDEAAVAAAIVL